VFFGDIPTALLYVSPREISPQAPFETPDAQTVNLTVQSGDKKSAGLQVTLLAQDPGIFIAVKSSGAAVSPSNPVMPGGTITIYATGLGLLSAPVASGEAGPSNPAASVAVAPVVTVGGQRMKVRFAGLAPGQVFSQINATAPHPAKSHF
jgi:uncharacterized protein (TIGR03437 family)